MFRIFLIAILLSGCTTVQVGKIDSAIQKTAPQVCDGILVAYAAFNATGLGSEKNKQIVATAYSSVVSLCADPTRITAAQLAVVTIKTGVIINEMRKVKANG